MCKKLLVFLIFVGYCQISICQEENNNLFEIAGISTTGINYNDEHTIIARSGLKVGNAIQIPGNEISRAIKILWELKLFKSIKILKEEKPGQLVYLEIVVVEKPQFAEHKIIGVKKRYQEDLTKIIDEKAMHIGRYIYFEDKYTIPANVVATGSGVIVSGLTAAHLQNDRKSIVIDTYTGEIEVLTKDSVIDIVRAYPEINSYWFNSKRKHENIEEVIIRINEKLRF